MSSSDNPQFQPQGTVSGDPGAVPPERVPSLTNGGDVPPIIIAPPPPRDPVWNGWDVLLIALVTLVLLIVAESLTVLVAWGISHRHNTFRDVLQNPALGLIGQLLADLFVALYMIMLVEGKYHVRFWPAIHWNWRSKAVPWMLGLGVATVVLDILGGLFLPLPKTTPFDELFSQPGAAYLIAAFAVTFGPFMEELFFRGFLYPVLARRTGAFAGVILTAIPFGAMHYVQYRSWGAVLVVTLVGVVLTTVRALTDSVAASFLVHVGYNATLMAFTAIETDGFRHMHKALLIW